MRLIQYGIAFMVAVSFIACSGNQSGERFKPYFDLKGYFAEESVRLQTLEGFEKVVVVNGEEERKRQEDLDWEAEFRAFSSSDINLPAWYDKYTIDSTFQEDQLVQLVYISTDTTLKTRQIQIAFSNGTPNAVLIDRESNSPLATTRQHLEYRPDEGYQMSSAQTLRLSEEKLVEVKVSWDR